MSGLFKVPEVQRFLGLFLSVLHHGLGNLGAEQSLPPRVVTVIQTGNKLAQYINDGKTTHD